MIFVTVGTDSPFDRLMQVVDEWAAASGRTDVFAQIGEGDDPGFLESRMRPRFGLISRGADARRRAPLLSPG